MALSHVMNIISNAGAVAAGAGAGAGGGGGGSLDSQAVTVGTARTRASGGSGAPSGSTTRSGLLKLSGAGGSISDGTSNVYGGAAILEIEYHVGYYLSYRSAQSHYRDGMGRANSGWTTLTIGTTSYQRAAATYASGAQSNGGNSGWFWYPSSYDYTGAANPFAATGQTTTCVFT